MVRTSENPDPKRSPRSWLRTPRKFQPAPSTQTTSSARGLGRWSRLVGACGVASSNRPPLARRLRDRLVCSLITHELIYLAIPAHPG